MEPQVGDLIEISREGYKHWAIYVGDGDVIHLVPTSKTPHAGSASKTPVACNEGFVKREKLQAVVGSDRSRVNNLLDDEYKPCDVDMTVKIADSQVGQVQPYCIFTRNCEHFVTDLRYGKPTSRQVRNAVGVAATVAAVFGLIAAAVLYWKSFIWKTPSKKKDEM